MGPRLGWRTKALVYRACDVLPGGRRLYAWSQRYVTRSVPRRLAPTRESAAVILQHREAFAALPPEGSYFEFGVGWDLYSNFLRWCDGCERQYAFDLRPWASVDLINAVIRHLQRDPPPGARRVPVATLRPGHLVEDLREHYDIAYRAPADARATGLPDGAVDCIATTSVLEHVPPRELAPLLTECRRLMHARSRMSHVIDYSDHFAHGDPAISPYHFLRYDERAWRRYNVALCYQNRWRHRDFLKLFEELGFRVVSASCYEPDDAEAQLARQPLAAPFAELDFADLAPLAAHIVLERA